MACRARSKYDQNVMPSGLLEALEDNFIKNKICSEAVSFQGPYFVYLIKKPIWIQHAIHLTAVSQMSQKVYICKSERVELFGCLVFY